jgi:hypothetical protein
VGSGLPGPIGETFGAFEPRFYGISFLLETPLAFEAFVARSEIFPGVAGPAPPIFEDTCLRTAIEHEMRHFHDALVSPFSNRILMLRMMAAFNGLKFFNRGLQSGANFLPVPVKRWMALNPNERAAWVANVSDLPPRLTPPLRPPPLPHFDGTADPFANMKPGFVDIGEGDWNAEMQMFANATTGAYMKAANMMRGPLTAVLRTSSTFQSYPEAKKREFEAIYTPRNVFEASALAVQLQAAWTNIGEEAFNALGNHLVTSDLGYAAAFRRIAWSSAPANNPEVVDPIRVSAVAVWCLLGDPKEPDDPAVRLTRLLQLLENDRGIAASDPVAALWDDWDERLKLNGWRTAVKEMRERTARSVTSYAAIQRKAGEGSAAVFANVLEVYLEDQTRATQLLLNDPDAYVNTHRYVTMTRGALPVPLVSVQLGANFIAPLETIPVNDAVRLPGLLDSKGVRGWNRAVIDIQRPPRPLLLDAVLELEFICKMSDVAFSDEALSQKDSEVILNSIAEASGMEPVNVF